MRTNKKSIWTRIGNRSRHLLGHSAVFVCVALFSVSCPSQLPQVMYLPFNEGTGASTADLASPGVPNSNPMLGNSNNWNTVSPYFGAAAWQPGSGANDVVQLGGTWTSSFDFTFEFAVFPAPASISSSPRLDIVHDSASYAIWLNSTLAGEYVIWIAGMPMTTPVPRNVWTFISLSFEAATGMIRQYFDGVLVETKQIFAPLFIGPGGPWVIGMHPISMMNNWEGAIDEFRVWNHVRSPGLIRAASLGEISAFDLGIGQILSPPQSLARCQYFSAAETVTVEICNPGTTTIFSGAVLPVSLHVDGALIATEFVTTTADLNPGDCMPYTFTATADLQAIGSHQVRVTVSLPGDTQVLNDQLELPFRGGGPGLVSEFPWTETFDSVVIPFSTPVTTPPYGWANSFWTFAYQPPAGISQPGIYTESDHTSGNTIFASTDVGAGTRILESPCIELNGIVNPTLAFYVNAEQFFSFAPLGTLQVDVVSVTTGIVTPAMAPLMNSGPDVWHLKRFDLTPMIGDVIYIRFTGNAGGLSVLSVDDVSIIDEALPLFGQSPQSTATLDISLSTNDHIQEVSSGEPGPYRKISADSFGVAVLDFVFSALPLQPVLLLSGDLNVAGATYPNIGQMDIGAPIDPFTGFPTALTVWGNGFAPTTGLDFLFYTDATGMLLLQAPMPPFPFPNIRRFPFGTFQAVMGLPTAPYFSLSNAVQLLFW